MTVLGLALAAVTAVAISLALNHSAATAGTVHSGTGTEQTCWAAAGPLLTAAAQAMDDAEMLDASPQVRWDAGPLPALLDLAVGR